MNYTSGLVNVLFLLGPPAGGNGIAVSYDYNVAADFSSVLANPEAWLEVKIDGAPLAPSQRLISVPYAMSSGSLGGILAETSTPSAGAIRWNGTAFEGFNGLGWVALSQTRLGSSPEMVTVGNAGNPDDTLSNGLTGSDTNSGAVAYTYKIGKYKVTNAEYAEFLNAVDPNAANSLDLYNNNMSIAVLAGPPPGSLYAGNNDKPVGYVSLYDAMRYCNWLHNGALEGGDTENGAYTLYGGMATPFNGTVVERNAGARFAVPTEDEWYKAAYYEPGGDADDYWLYPTRGNSSPTATTPPGVAPAANYNNATNGPVSVGAYTTTIGYYGTFDMAGNVHEWIESFDGAGRILRGGAWADDTAILRSSNINSVGPSVEFDYLGFRVVSP